MKCSAMIFLVVFTLQTNAQNWAPIGAKWIYGHWMYVNGDTETVTRSGVIDVVGDTIIQGKLCSKLVKTNFEIFFDGRPDVEYMYLSNDTVFFYDTVFTEFQVIYCFNANVGDSWVIKTSSPIDELDIDSVKVIVDAVSVLNVNSNLLTQLDVTYYRFSDGDIHSQYTSSIVETLGDLESMFNYNNQPAIYYWSPLELRCYDDVLIGHYEAIGVGGNCFISTDENIIPQLTIYPNPTNNKIFLNSSSDYYQIYSCDGKLIQSGNLGSAQSIDVSCLQNGIYFLVLNSDQGSQTVRFVKK